MKIPVGQILVIPNSHESNCFWPHLEVKVRKKIATTTFSATRLAIADMLQVRYLEKAQCKALCSLALHPNIIWARCEEPNHLRAIIKSLAYSHSSVVCEKSENNPHLKTHKNCLIMWSKKQTEF